MGKGPQLGEWRTVERAPIIAGWFQAQHNSKFVRSKYVHRAEFFTTPTNLVAQPL